MKREFLKLCLFLLVSFFARPIYANEANCACMEYEDIKTEKEVYESPQKHRESTVEFSEIRFEYEDVRIAEY